MAKFGIKLTGLVAANKVINSLLKGSKGEAARKGLRRWGETVMLEAKKETPVDTGALRSSGRVETPSGVKPTIRLVFGGGPVNYAVPVHENMNARHRVGKAKFLSDPVKRLMPKLSEFVRREILRGGTR